MTLIIAGDRSGVGKTTITLALLAYLIQKGSKVQSFKVGPDFIDPMFHTNITGRFCRNLDPILTSETYVKSCFSQHCQGVDYALIEGVMGLFDGIPFPNLSKHKQEQATEIIETGKNSNLPYASTAHIAQLLQIPVVLVIDCSRLSGSVAAIAHGYLSFDPSIHIIGVILNRVGSDRHLALLEAALTSLKLPILGIVRRQDILTIPDRHLGLVPTEELTNFNNFVQKLVHLAQNAFNWDLLLPHLSLSPASHFPPPKLPVATSASVKIAIARDRAFNFYYPDNLDILEKLGAELVYWSPIEDKKIPEGTAGLYFGGGFPEVFAKKLSQNQQALQAVKTAISQGMPTYAECGGLMYLCQEIITFDSQCWPMVGILPTTAKMDKSLTLGYRQAMATGDSLLLKSDDVFWGHEFHRSKLTESSPRPLFELYSWYGDHPLYAEGWQHPRNLHASYVHLHFGGCPTVAQKFLRHCLDFSKLLTLD